MKSRRASFFSAFAAVPYFTKEQLQNEALKFLLPKSTFNSYISRSLQEGELIKLKRNYYVTRDFYEKNKTDTSYLFYLSNVLIKPSYVSLQSALQYYGLFAEAVQHSVTAVTLKLPRKFANRFGQYFYRHMNENFFTGFQYIKNNFEFIIALPHKAIFDYLYYQTEQFTKNVHCDLLEELRIDLDELPIREKKLLLELIAKFTSVKINL